MRNHTLRRQPLGSVTFGMLLTAVSLACNSAGATAHETVFKDLRIVHPFTFEPTERLPQTAPVYMTIRNSGARPDRLIAVDAPFAAKASLIEVPPSGTGPRTVPAIIIPAGGETVLGAKTAFVLLHKLNEPLEGYEYFTISLTFEIAGKVDIEVCVEDRK
jgi:periplasmic copper chaperone A